MAMDFALILDIVVVVIILISSVVAFLRGFVREVLTILGLVGASMTALTAGPKLAPGIESWLTKDLGADALDEKMWGMIPYDIAAGFFAYAGLFVITLVVLSLVSHWIAKSVHAIGLGPVDRSMGVVFGVLRGVILIGFLYMPFHILMDAKDKKGWFGTSNTYSYVEYTSQIMTAMLPESWSRKGDDKDKNDDEKSLDPLKNLTGENGKDFGNDEGAAEEDDKDDVDGVPDNGVGYDDIQRQAIDVLIDNQDKIKKLIEGVSSKGTTNE